MKITHEKYTHLYIIFMATYNENPDAGPLGHYTHDGHWESYYKYLTFIEESICNTLFTLKKNSIPCNKM